MKKLFLGLLLLTICASNFFAQSSLEAKIRLFNENVYASSSSVNIQVEIVNNDIVARSFKLADNRVHNLQFDVRTMTNTKISECDNCIKEFISSQPVYYSAITLKPGELFSFIVKLSDFVELTTSGKYLVKGYFFTEFRSISETPIASNTIELNINNSYSDSSSEFELSLPTKSLALTPKSIYPDEVVKYTIEARKKIEATKDYETKIKLWEEFFLYLDLEELYLKSGEENREYLSLSQDARERKIGEFKEWLIAGSKDKDFLMTPTDYKITKTSYSENNSVVVVYEQFNNGAFVEKKQYSYFLKKIDTVWYIYDYAIVNMMDGSVS